MNEEYDDVGWLDIPDYERWQASIDGRIRNKKTKHILKPHSDKYGYQVLSLGNKNNLFVHRLVCSAFYGKPKNSKMQVNHIDCDRSNNRSYNLEWVTPSENISYGVRCGAIDPSKGSRAAREVSMRPVKIIETGQIFESIKECARYLNVNPNRVSRVITGSRKGQAIHGYHVVHV